MKLQTIAISGLILLSTHVYSQALGINEDGTTPQTMLHIKQDGSTGAVQEVIRIENTPSGAASAGIGAGISFHVKDGTGSSEEQATINVELDDVSSGAEDATITFDVNQGGSLSEIMRMDGTDGYVGIGTTSPSSLLHISNEMNAWTDQTLQIDNTGTANASNILLNATNTGNSNIRFAENASDKGAILWDNTNNYLSLLNMDWSVGDNTLVMEV